MNRMCLAVVLSLFPVLLSVCLLSAVVFAHGCSLPLRRGAAMRYHTDPPPVRPALPFCALQGAEPCLG